MVAPARRKQALWARSRLASLVVAELQICINSGMWTILMLSCTPCVTTAQKWSRGARSSGGVPKGYTDYREMLGDRSIDAVEILAPTHLHEEMAVAALETGRHVALQKPMTLTMDSVERILSAASKAKGIFKVSDNYVHYPPLALAARIVADGVIGTPHNLRIKMFAGNDNSGWEVPQATWEWRIRENEAGRPRQTFDHGHHLWAVAWYLMGEIDRVVAWIDFVNEGSVDSPAAIMWKHREPYRMGMCEYCYAHDLAIPTKYYACDEWFEITGSRGMVSVNRCTGNLLDGPPVSVFTNEGWKHYTDVPSDWSEGFVGAARNFVDAILGRADPMLTGKQAKHVMDFNFAIQQSAREQREIELPS